MKKLLTTISLIAAITASFTTSYADSSENFQMPSLYQQGIDTASEFEEKYIDGTNQHWDVTAAYNGFADKMAGKKLKTFPEDINDTASLIIGYTVGEIFKIGYLFPPNLRLKDEQYNQKIVMQAIDNHYIDGVKPKYPLLSEKDFKEIEETKTLPENISNEQFSYSLGYIKFADRLQEYNDIDIKAFITGMKMAIANQKYTFSNEQISAASYVFGASLYEADNNGFKNQQEKDEFLKGFASVANSK